MKTFFTSDYHFSDKAIIEICDRPFNTIDSMNESIITSHNSVVGVDDIVYYLGDFSRDTFSNAKNLFKQLNGTINIVLGNHDLDNYSEVKESIIDAQSIGFNMVYDLPIIFNDFFVLSHKRLEWIDRKGVYANIHGHEHNRIDLPIVTPRTINVSIDNWWRPLNFEEVKKEIHLAN